MRRPDFRVLASVVVLAVLGCGEDAPTRPSVGPAVAAVSGKAALQAQVNSLINALFAPKDQGAIQKDFARIKNAVASGRTAEAETGIVAFVKTLLGASAGGVLQDPNGAQPPSIPEALQSLVNNVAQFGGLPPPIPASNPFAGDGAIAVVGTAGGTVVSESGFGGAGFPPGALPADVIVVVARIPDPVVPGAGPLPTTLTQFPLFYDFSTSPLVAQFAVPVTVGICQLEVGEPFGPPTQAVADRLQLAHPDPANPGTVELLDRQLAAFINCNGVTLAQALEAESWGGKALAYLVSSGSRVLSLFRPSVAYAVHGGLGGRTTSFSPFAAVDPGILFVEIGAGELYSCGLRSDGKAFCWGTNSFGRLGDGTQTSSLTPVPVAGGVVFSKLAIGNATACGITGAGVTYCWGSNTAGELGAGLPTGVGQFSTLPVLVSGGMTFNSVSVGLQHVCGSATDGVTYCWGRNDAGQLGNGAVGGLSSIPVAVSNSAVLGIQGVSAGFQHTCGLTGSAALYCWGASGRFGNGSSAAQIPVPTPAGNGLPFSAVDAGGLYTCGLTLSGAGMCWGSNVVGEVGNGNTTVQSVPTAVVGGLLFQMLDANMTNNVLAHTCAVTATNQAYCWGSNRMLQLGAPGADTCTFGVLIFNCSRSPVAVSGGLQFRTVAGGLEHTCGIALDFAAYCWGRNDAGQLGDGTTTNRAAPVRVVP